MASVIYNVYMRYTSRVPFFRRRVVVVLVALLVELWALKFSPGALAPAPNHPGSSLNLHDIRFIYSISKINTYSNNNIVVTNINYNNHFLTLLNRLQIIFSIVVIKLLNMEYVHI